MAAPPVETPVAEEEPVVVAEPNVSGGAQAPPAVGEEPVAETPAAAPVTPAEPAAPAEPTAPPAEPAEPVGSVPTEPAPSTPPTEH